MLTAQITTSHRVWLLFATLSISCGGSALPDSAEPDASNDSLLSERIAEIAATYVDPAGSADRAVGMVVVAITPTEREVLGFGARSIGGEPPDRDTVFHLASVAKAIGGLALAVAEHSGDVSLGDPVRDHLASSVPPPSVGGVEINLEHLVTHSSGLPVLPSNVLDRDGDGEIDEAAMMCCPANDYTRGDLETEFQRYADGLETLGFMPGATYLYSNLGSGLLGLALADALGHANVDAALEALVFAPLGMSSTEVRSDELESSIRDNAAIGYAPDGSGGLMAVPYTDVGVLSAGGGVLSTAADMERFLLAELGLDTGELASAAIDRSQQILRESAGGRVIAFAIESSDGGIVYNKGGTNAGFKTFVRFSPETQRGVVVLASGSGADAMGAALDIFDLLGGE